MLNEREPAPGNNPAASVLYPTLPDENPPCVVPGLIGAHQNVVGLATVADLPALADRCVIRRTSPAFGAASDAMTDPCAPWVALEAGRLLDAERLDNR